YDPLRGRMVVFGGCTGGQITTNHVFGDVWALSLRGTPSWSAILASGTPPGPRSGHSAIYDPIRDRMVVFGGCSGDSTDGVWALSLGDPPTWARLATTGLPPAGCSEPAAEYDPVRDRMVVMTGGDQVRTWGLSLSGTPAWSELSPSGVPNSRPEVSAIYDPTLDRVVMFGNDSEGHQDDVWSLSLSPQLTS